ncbi:MAG: RNA-processing protein [Candidatus Aenigmatarchaeota archaeon]|nr:MAG: RNA-processing protein [Candidatus Aenigmarchaeota archaeon]
MVIKEIAIPEERKAVLIGKDGETKEEIESLTKTTITVSDGIMIKGEVENALKAKNIVEAIGRGFSPKHALRLIDEDCQLEIISLEGETDNTRKRLFGRVIGRKGATRKIIEQTTGCLLSVYGKTVSIIGTAREIDLARSAVEDLLEGRQHSYVYARLKR